MQKSLIDSISRKYDDSAMIVASIYSVTPDYVRKVVRDSNSHVYKGAKANNIREAFKQYKSGKNNLIKAIESQIKIA